MPLSYAVQAVVHQHVSRLQPLTRSASPWLAAPRPWSRAVAPKWHLNKGGTSVQKEGIPGGRCAAFRGGRGSQEGGWREDIAVLTYTNPEGLKVTDRCA